MKIISVTKDRSGNGATTRRKTRPGQATRSAKTKKKSFMIADENTFLDETKASQIDITLNESMMSTSDNKELFGLYDNFL